MVLHYRVNHPNLQQVHFDDSLVLQGKINVNYLIILLGDLANGKTEDKLTEPPIANGITDDNAKVGAEMMDERVNPL